MYIYVDMVNVSFNIIIIIIIITIICIFSFYRGPQGRLAIIANCVTLFKHCINK